MKRFRFSLASLIGLVCAAGVVFGTWRYSNRVGASLIAVVSMFAMCSATVAGIFGIERTKRVWLPFAIFAWGYYVAAMMFGYPNLLGPYTVEYLTGGSSDFVPNLALAVVFDSVFSLAFGLLGSAVCNVYWKLHGSGRDEKRPDGPQ